MLRRAWIAAGALCAAALAAEAQDEPHGAGAVPTIMVEGQASREVTPDMAVITLGVVTDRATALDAAQQNGQTVKALVTQIKAGGIADRDIETTQATLSPVYNDPKNGEAPRVKGFQAANVVQIKVRTVADAGPLAGRLIDKGANTLQGIDFTVADPAPVLDVLRAEATKDARRRAEIYAAAAGAKLGRVLAIRPDQQPDFVMARRPAPSAMREAVAVPLQAGTQRLDARVTITWSLDEDRR